MRRKRCGGRYLRQMLYQLSYNGDNPVGGNRTRNTLLGFIGTSYATKRFRRSVTRWYGNKARIFCFRGTLVANVSADCNYGELNPCFLGF